MDALSSFTHDAHSLDVTPRLKYNAEGDVVFNFGKYVGRPVVEMLSQDRAYYNWIMNKEFSIQVKHTKDKRARECLFTIGTKAWQRSRRHRNRRRIGTRSRGQER